MWSSASSTSSRPLRSRGSPRYPNASVEFSARLTDLELHDDRVEVAVETGRGRQSVTGSYLIGADGGRSTVRKALGIAFEGYTHPERFLVLTTPYPFDGDFAQCSRNYFSDPDEWCALFKVSGDDGRGLWRVVFPTAADETQEAGVRRKTAVQGRLQKFFPKPGAYPVVHRNIYAVHQRVAASFRKGRAFLAGDSAHVNNPLGGLGLNFGIHDGMELVRSLGRVIREEARARDARSLRPVSPAAQCRIRPAADHRQQEAARGEGPGGARRRTTPSCAHRRRPGRAPRLPAARLAARQRPQAPGRARMRTLRD